MAAAAAFHSLAYTQQVESDFHSNVTPVQSGGKFHVATGTWTRNLPEAVQLGPDIIYNNTANTGGFTTGLINLQTESFEFVDAGRIPTTSSLTPTANRDHYNVNCIELSYCVEDDSTATGPLNVEVRLYNRYSVCLDPVEGLMVGRFLATGLPNYDPVQTPSGYFDCWTVELDLSGGQEICLLGDGDGVFQGDLAFDQFGIGVSFDPGGTGGYVGNIRVGPLLAGDRQWTANAVGGLTTPSGGGNTYYGPAETCVPTAGGENSSGFDQEDFWWIGERGGSGIAAGCYWFGGSNNSTGCAANGTQSGHTPHTGLYALLRADTSTQCVEAHQGFADSTFCDPATPNSTGLPAVLSASSLESGVGTGVHLTGHGGPAGELGYILIGSAPEIANPAPLGNGFLCLSMSGGNLTGSYNFGTTTHSVGQFSSLGNFHNLVGTGSSSGDVGFDVPTTNPIAGQGAILAGSTWYFQMWYRDSPAGVGQSNLTNGLSITF